MNKVSAFLWALVLVSLVELVGAFALVGNLRPFRRPLNLFLESFRTDCNGQWANFREDIL